MEHSGDGTTESSQMLHYITPYLAWRYHEKNENTSIQNKTEGHRQKLINNVDKTTERDSIERDSTV
jgi:hypothetical protein